MSSSADLPTTAIRNRTRSPPASPSFELSWEPDPTEIPARACTCSFCTKHGGVWTSSPSASLQVLVKDASSVSKYSFGTRTAAFHICSRCGVVPVVTSTIEGRLYAVVSVNALENIEPSSIKAASMSFEGETEASRLARRKRGWIGNVDYVEGGT